jgi:hypothetical protein
MSFPALWNSLTILPSVPVVEAKHQAPPSSADLDSHLPRWERHPGTGRATGSLDPEWIRRHLP